MSPDPVLYYNIVQNKLKKGEGNRCKTKTSDISLRIVFSKIVK
jgi:hypothetical protein